MTTLPEFVEARIAEKETRARALMRVAQDAQLALEDARLLGRRIPGWHSWPDVEAMCGQALREAAAMRAILAEHCTWTDRYGPDPILGMNVEQYCLGCGQNSMEESRSPELEDCPTLRALAAIWAEHPHYEKSWAPEEVTA